MFVDGKNLGHCDFCGGRPVVWSVECDTSEIDGQVSVEGWAACEPCGATIQANDRDGLLERAVAAYDLAKATASPLSEFAREWVRQFQAAFWQHRRHGLERVAARPFGH